MTMSSDRAANAGFRAVASMAAMLLVTAGCSNASDGATGTELRDSDVATTVQVDATAPVAPPASTTEVVTPAPTPAPTPATDAPTDASADAPTITVAPREPFDLQTIPELVDLTDRAVGDSTISPLDVAQQLVGFPYEIPVPDGSTLLRVFADVSVRNGDVFATDFGYGVIADGGVVPDVDITLDDNGPGSVEVATVWNPIMAALGFERVSSTTSDPGDPGGPNAVNHVYVALNPNGRFNGVPGVVDPVYVWSDEDINGGSFSSRDILGGYRINLGVETQTDASIPVPLIESLLGVIPVPDDVTLSDVDVRLHKRDVDSFEAERGRTYIDISIEWNAEPGSVDDIIEFYGDPTSLFTDDATLMAGEDDFFNPGTIERTDLTTYNSTGRRLKMLLLGRYGGTLGIDASLDGIEPVTVSFDFRLDAIAPILEPPVE